MNSVGVIEQGKVSAHQLKEGGPS